MEQPAILRIDHLPLATMASVNSYASMLEPEEIFDLSPLPGVRRIPS